VGDVPTGPLLPGPAAGAAPPAPAARASARCPAPRASARLHTHRTHSAVVSTAARHPAAGGSAVSARTAQHVPAAPARARHRSLRRFTSAALPS